MEIAKECICCNGTLFTVTPSVLMPFISYRIFGWQPVKIEGFRDLAAGISYSTCNTLECQSCKTRFLDMRFSDEEMQNLYSEYMSTHYIMDRKKFEPNFNVQRATNPRRYREKVEFFIEPFLPSMPIKILDFGSSNLKNTPFIHSNNLIDLYDIG